MERQEFITEANLHTLARKKRKSNNVNKRRFSDEQIKSLESIFSSSESKLESSKKVQLATELGLQPRQIAIWFQNKRARCKSKKIENDFRSLRANYDNLASQFITLQEEKTTLLLQVQTLSELVREGTHEVNYSYENQANRKNLCCELGKNGVKYLNINYKTDKDGEDDQGLQATELMERKGNRISNTEKRVCQVLNSNGLYKSSDKWCGFESDGVDFDYQSSSSLEGQYFW